MILDFLPRRASLQLQILCRKVYDEILPQYFKAVPLPMNPKYNQFCYFDFETMAVAKLKGGDEDSLRGSGASSENKQL